MLERKYLNSNKLRKQLEWLLDGYMQSFQFLYFAVNNYKEWQAMLNWLMRNNIRGKKIEEFFLENNGFHGGCVEIISRMHGNHFKEKITINELQ